MNFGTLGAHEIAGRMERPNSGKSTPTYSKKKVGKSGGKMGLKCKTSSIP